MVAVSVPVPDMVAFVVVLEKAEVAFVSPALDMVVVAVGQTTAAASAADRMVAEAFVVVLGMGLLVLVAFAVAVRDIVAASPVVVAFVRGMATFVARTEVALLWGALVW